MSIGKSNRLINTPNAIAIVDGLQLNSILSAKLGVPSAFGNVGLKVASLHATVKQAAERVAALANDQTRTEVSKHAAAKKLATEAVRAIRNVQAELKAHAERLNREAANKAHEIFAPRPGYAHIESEIRVWVKEQAKTDAGMSKIKHLIANDKDVASVVFHSPNFLLGLADETHASFMHSIVQKFAPEATRMFAEAANIEHVLPSYDRTAYDIEASFYNSALADKANSRVEV
ncbi:hypothetical protein Rvan_3128 [Rhodomicrobium vannielii ATCC 17100]|uniref:Uncharacterized protein n=1 Tax=Rhodomicrobium vannielii (strain ATCC 17100 / DSM 162 / LMG 4299 / NCIMB 10020 / ATH 3.1.1) TaxID=648757 RepID=E3I107_RHOVT|nr:hypothetical protein [Rhodomicrobium vannielii]ADP72330.1 hypothetical protein Rvan_3128 [Rhodomicrobium vannielii ATCC 17100]